MADTCSSLQKSVDWCEGTPVLPGIRTRLYYINKKRIVSWPSLSINGIGQATTAKYIGAFTLAANAKWQYIDVIANTASVTSEVQGEYPSQTQLNKINVIHAGTGEEASLLPSVFNNSDNVFIIETSGGKFRVVGSEMYDTKTSVNQDLGQSGSSSGSTTIAVEASDRVPAPYYTGKIVAEDGIINDDGDDDTVEYNEPLQLIILTGDSDSYDEEAETISTVASYDEATETIKF